MPVQPKTGTGFTNLSKLIGANKNNKVGQTLGSGVSGVAGKARTGLAGAENEFNTGLGQEKSKFGEQQGQVQSVFNKLEQDPNQIGEAEAGQFSNLRNTIYQGPQGLNNTQQLQGQANRAEETGALTRSAGGREELLKQFVGNKALPYQQGARKFDAMLLGQGPQAQLKQARRDTVGLGQQVQNKAMSAEEQARAQNQAIEQFKQETGQKLNTQQTETSNQIDQALEGLKAGTADKQKFIERAKANIAVGDPNNYALQDLRAAGVPEDQISDIKELMLQATTGNKYNDKYTNNAAAALQSLSAGINAGDTPLTRSYAASDLQRNKMNALAKLSGSQEEFSSPREQGRNAGLGQVGSELSSKLKGAYDDYYKPYQAEADYYNQAVANRENPIWSDPKMVDAIKKQFGGSVQDFKKTLLSQGAGALTGSGVGAQLYGMADNNALGADYNGGRRQILTDALNQAIQQGQLTQQGKLASDTVANRAQREDTLNRILAKYR